MSAFDDFTAAFGNAVDDVRQKIIEEPMWGRSLGESEPAPQWPGAEPQPAFGSATRNIDMGPTHDQIQDNANYREAAMERDQPEPDRDLDR
jgi:hypothetical protein